METEQMFAKFRLSGCAHLKDRMLLGEVPAETVSTVLEPLLSNFYELMLQLPSDMQADFENILRIYSDVAESYGIWIKPPILESLKHFAQYWLKIDPKGFTPGFDFLAAAESQEEFLDAGVFVKEGQGFFCTDRGNSVYLEFFYSEGDECASFEYWPPEFAVRIEICGIRILILTPSRPKQDIAVEDLSKILMKCARDVTVNVFEVDSKRDEDLLSNLDCCI